jgi:crossover junction endodeoxyribonuclease RuvC
MVKQKMLPQAKRSPPNQIVLGIDPGIALVGYAVLLVQREAITCQACDVIRTRSAASLPERLLTLYKQVNVLLRDCTPTDVAVETLFIGSNRSTALSVGHARGVLLLAMQQRHLPIAEYAPSTIKRVIAGHGNAKKAQIGQRVQEILKLAAVPRPDDAADAAAVALCHVFTLFPQFLERKD